MTEPSSPSPLPTPATSTLRHGEQITWTVDRKVGVAAIVAWVMAILGGVYVYGMQSEAINGIKSDRSDIKSSLKEVKEATEVARNARGTQGDPGPRGETGPKGDAGPVGPQGQKGDRGEKGDLGSKGDVGPKGEKGDKGDTGPRGERGEPGPRGEMGPRGKPRIFRTGTIALVQGDPAPVVRGDGGLVGHVTESQYTPADGTLVTKWSGEIRFDADGIDAFSRPPKVIAGIQLVTTTGGTLLSVERVDITRVSGASASFEATATYSKETRFRFFWMAIDDE